MKHLNSNKKKKNNVIVTASATLFTLATIIIVLVSNMATIPVAAGFRVEIEDAPLVVSGDNIYIAWWTNNTENGNEEVMFRASTDGGATFSDKINLSNTTDADSNRVQIHGEADTVVVSWWESNQTSDTPVARISTDAGETFGPLVMLGINGTISTTTEVEEEEAAAANGGE
jgi:hypothetical protein